MKNVEDVLYDGINYILCKLIKPNMEYSKVTEISSFEIDKLINYYNIKGIILDIDETIRFDMNDISIENEKWLDMITSKLKVIVLSNGIDYKIQNKLKQKNIEYIGNAFKPLKYNFLKACKILDLNPYEVVVIGDDILCDIYGGKRNKMFTIKISDRYN